MVSLGQKLRERRKTLRMSQKTLASIVGVSHVSVSQWESDENKPKTESFLRLANALKLPLEELFLDTELATLSDELFESLVLSVYPRLAKDRRKKLIAALWDIDARLGEST